MDTDMISAVWIPLNPSDVPALEQLLSESDPFVTSTIDTSNPYRLIDYVQNSVYGEIEIAAILDRNLVSRVVKLARGEMIDHSANGTDSDRVAAACMSFLITAKFLTEPNISLYELTESVADHDDSHIQLEAFRIADHLHPQAYLEVALGRAPGIHPELIEEARQLVLAGTPDSQTVDFAMPLRHWRRHRCSLTQLALLERSTKSGVEKLREFLDWSIDPGFFDASVIAFAVRLFGRDKPPGKLLKSAKSMSLEKCLAGIRNASWDLTYISYWSSQSRKDEKKRIWILCTYDKVLRDIARVAVGEDGNDFRLFQDNWLPSEAKELYSHYRDTCQKAFNSEERAQIIEQRFAEIDTLRTSIEKQIQASIVEQSAG